MSRLLASRVGVMLCVALGVALCLPSITTGLVADDWFHTLMLEHRQLPGMSHRFLDIFCFANGNPADAHQMMDAGAFPWWTDPTVRLAFLRPITALTHALDYALWPDSPVAMHLQSVLWYGIALAVAAFTYRRLLPLTAAGLALLLFAVDHVHGPTVAWVANRNALIALALGLPALAWHHRWRSEGWRPGAWLAPASLGVALLAGEGAIAMLGYMTAYAWHVDRAPWRQRLLSLAPGVAIIVCWRVVYNALGYGASGSGAYLDPAREPLVFAAKVPSRVIALLASQLATPWADFAETYVYVSQRLAIGMLLLELAVVAIAALAFVPLLRSDRIARMFATGVLFATIPICATLPADRLLGFVGFGVMALIARLILEPKRWPLKIVAGGFVMFHLVLSPLFLLARSRSMETVESPLKRARVSLAAGMQASPAGIPVADKTVVLMNPPMDPIAGYLPLTLAGKREPRPGHIRWLATGLTEIAVTRDDARTLTVRPKGGFAARISEQMLREPGRRFTPGQHIELTGLDIEVLQTEADGRPAEARFRFDKPLEDPSFVWLRWEKTRFVPFVPPAIGTSTTLAPTDIFEAMLTPG